MRWNEVNGMEKALKIKLLMGTIFICIFVTVVAITLVQKYK